MAVEYLSKLSKAIERAAGKRAASVNRRAVYKAIDKRDGYLCRACGRHLQVTFAAVINRIERHHVVARSQGGETSTKNMACICRGCHDRRHVTRELEITGNADETLLITLTKLPWPSDPQVWRSTAGQELERVF